ncbi:MAG: ester cyclase [Anaerolineaceae bacterium]|nr:ester cyclase [Anaerolineaceae bacterium]
MSTEQNKALDRRLVEEGITKGNMAVIEEIIDKNVVDHSLASMGLPDGIAGVKQLFSMLHSAFPDLNYMIEDVIAEGDKVVTRSTWTGTNRGDFMGMPATNKQVKVSGIDITRFAGGKAVEHWATTDMLGLMQQLGAGKQ